MPFLSDPELVEKAVAGDMQAFRRLVERHQGFVYALCYRLVGTVGDAEDITQEAFIRLWRNLSRYRDDIKLTTWLYKIVTNLCLDFLKSAYNKHTKRSLQLDDHGIMFGHWTADQPLLNEELAIALDRISGLTKERDDGGLVCRFFIGFYGLG